LKLYLADSMEVLTGERQRRTREFLRNITKRDFATENEWQNALDQIRSTNPWQMSVFEAQDRVSLIRRNRDHYPGSRNPGRFTREDWFELRES